ncbi:MAG: DUF3137 domain-containing protein [Thermoplasmatales archaeon]|nr:DUF3137 domain-containing protein [Thermoplasmatales archaeon]
MKKDEDKKKTSFQEKIQDFAIKHGHYAPPTKKDFLKEHELLKSQSLKRNGKFHKSISFGRSYFIFNHHNLDIKVGNKLVERGQNDYRTDTYVKVKFNLMNKFRLSVYIKDISFFRTEEITTYPNLAITQYLLRLKKIEMLNKEFNEKFTVKTNDESIAIYLLNNNIQNQLVSLEYQYFYPVVNINKKEFLLFAMNRLSEEKEYDELINTALMFLDRLRLLGFFRKLKKH